MTETRLFIKRGFCAVMAVLLLCTALSPSVLAETLTAGTAETDILAPTTPVACHNIGVFEEDSMTVWGLCDHTTIEHYLTLFEDKEDIHHVAVLKNGEPLTTGVPENGMVVRLYQNEDEYRDYTVVGMNTAPSLTVPAEAQSTNANTRSVTTNPYGFTLPLDDMNLSSHIYSPYGIRDGVPHDGIDISWGGIYGTPIKAVRGGIATVLDQGPEYGYGKFVIIDHDTIDGVGVKTLYAHMSSVSVSTGEHVTPGQILGYVGSTGKSSGPHLHFEVQINGNAVDPVPYLTGAGNAPPDGSPTGTLSSVTAGAAKVQVQGTAQDPNQPDTAIQIHVYIGGPAGDPNAIGYGNGITNASTQTFDYTVVTTKRGEQDVYVYAINVGAGSNVLLGHVTVTFTGNPVGYYDSATAGYGTVRVEGWAFDYDRPSSSVSIHVYIGGPAGASGVEGHDLGPTDKLRTDVNNENNIQGNHGFESTITTNKRGEQKVCIYVTNFDTGSMILLGKKTVTIPTGNPIGNYDTATGGNGNVIVTGWAFDPDQPSTAIQIHVYIGGPAGASGAVGYNAGVTTVTRNDVNNTYHISGAHGFIKTITTTKTGTQEVYVYAINVGAGGSKLLGSKTVTIT